jgi:hypothetical protein
MMLKIAHGHQLAASIDLPAEIRDTIREAVTILDNEYGMMRFLVDFKNTLLPKQDSRDRSS